MERQRRRKKYLVFGREVNAPDSVARVSAPLAVPTTCHYCQEAVELVNNKVFYGGQEYGWPLAYRCVGCGARVGCHPGTDIPLGTLADETTMKARQMAHAAFDPLWRGKTNWHRQAAYRALARVMGVRQAHISHFDARECARVIELCAAGALTM